MSPRPALLLAALLAAPCPAPACSLCLNLGQAPPTFREEAAQAQCQLILYGTLANPRLVGTGGVTELHVAAVLRDHRARAGKKVVEVPRYIPVSDPKDPPRFLVFCDVFGDKLDTYRGVPVKSAAVVEYVKGALQLDAKDATRRLLYFFDHLENADKEVAQDAFLEFVKATDQEIGQVAGKLAADKLRRWVKDPQLPAERLGLYGFLLGACGTAEDAALLRSLLQEPNDRTGPAFDGLLGGYVRLRPQEGWDLALATLRDPKQSLTVRLAVLRTLRFYHGWKPAESRARVLAGLELLLARPDLADLAIDDLRRWQEWDLTRSVLALYGQKGYDAPIMRKAIVRYALSCPQPEAADLAARARKADPELVREAEESLRNERRER